MQTPLEHAVAGEVLAEIKRQRYTYKDIQAMSGVKSRAFSYYFIASERSIPLHVLDAVCAALGVATSEMIARGAARVAQSDDPVRDELLSGMSPRNRRAALELSPEPDPKPASEDRRRRSS